MIITLIMLLKLKSSFILIILQVLEINRVIVYATTIIDYKYRLHSNG